jgi:hypothetical protein
LPGQAVSESLLGWPAALDGGAATRDDGGVSQEKEKEATMAKMVQFTELAHNSPVYVNADNVKTVRNNPASPGSSAIEMMDGKMIYVIEPHADVSKKLTM